jgi:geranylgeranyl reductase family protein
MTDVLIVGGGPAGALTALILARAGVHVTVLDRATFPRDKLCGDSLNPGAMAILARHGLASAVSARALAVHGMMLTGPGGAVVRARYPPGVSGCSIRRRDLDRVLLEQASSAGARVEFATRVSGPIAGQTARGWHVSGVDVQRRSGVERRTAKVVIAADGRRSTLGLALGLVRHPRRPRRWAIGAYFESVAGLGDMGEMHVRRDHYIGVAPVPDGLTNACLVVTEQQARAVGPRNALEQALTSDPMLAERFRGAHPVSNVAVLGPLAVDASAAGVEGMLLAGDAGGFVDPITGDGLRLALSSAELAAAAALETLHGAPDVHRRLAHRRRRAMGVKLFANRRLRALVGRPSGVEAMAALARLWPGALAPLADYAGDVTSSVRRASSEAAI